MINGQVGKLLIAFATLFPAQISISEAVTTFGCRDISTGGPTDKIDVSICLVGDDFFAVKDLDVIIKNRTSERLKVVIQCKTTFAPHGEFSQKTFDTGGLTFLMSERTQIDKYIILPQINNGSQQSWRNVSTNSCTWTVEKLQEERPQDVLRVIIPDRNR